jgi:nucleoside-diphosphate kinase
MERTLVLLKPDSVKRHLTGKIISRFEDTGLKIIAMKMVWANEELAKEHYILDEEWAKNVYDKTKAVYEKEGKEMKYQNHLEWGELIQKRNMDFLREGPVIAIILEGPHAVEIVRKMIGATEPRSAAPGTIRGDFTSVESYPIADVNSRVARNLVHASDSVKNAEREIRLWFRPEEIYMHKTVYDLTLPNKPL